MIPDWSADRRSIKQARSEIETSKQHLSFISESVGQGRAAVKRSEALIEASLKVLDSLNDQHGGPVISRTIATAWQRIAMRRHF